MNILKKIIKKRFKVRLKIFDLTLGRVIKDDETYVKWRYLFGMLKWPNLKAPKTFQEKIQWLKLNNQRTEYSRLVDKYEAKFWVSECLGTDKYNIPTLGVWDSIEEVNFDDLPEQFVMKCTHDSYGLIVCKNKSKLDLDKVRKRFSEGLKRNYFKVEREYPYKYVRPRIIAEKYMHDDKSEDLIDYKFFCFDGEPMYCQVIKDRSTTENIAFYDKNWNMMEFVGLNPIATLSTTKTPRPDKLDEMLDISRKLSKDKTFARVDLYYINGAVYFGEITFFPNGGLGWFRPRGWDLKMGDLVKI